jgi:hypothetical protein
MAEEFAEEAISSHFVYSQMATENSLSPPLYFNLKKRLGRGVFPVIQDAGPRLSSRKTMPETTRSPVESCRAKSHEEIERRGR